MGEKREKSGSDCSLSRQLSLFDGFLDAIEIAKNQYGFSEEEAELARRLLSEARGSFENAGLEAGKKRAEAKRKKAEEERARRESHIAKVTSMELPMDWENPFSSDERASGVHADSIPDGLILSLATLGHVDIEFIASVTGADLAEIIHTLKGSIFQDPVKWDECFYKGWETREEYLSGNLRRKLAAAKSANKKYHGYFKENIDAILAVLPVALTQEEIYITLGSPWVPADVIDDFIEALFGPNPALHYYCIGPGQEEKREMKQAVYRVKHDEITGSWEIPVKTRYAHSIKTDLEYGTARINALHILERTLNMRTIAVYDTVPCAAAASGKRKELNKSETALALEKQSRLIREFQNWVWAEPNRRERLKRIYDDQYSCVKKRHFDGSFLTFPEMAPGISLYPHQRNAVARILFSPNTLLAHDVGSGKTYTMIAAGMELRRMGLSRKNLFVVPNDLVGQWKEMFLRLYPGASVLCVDPQHFSSSKRQAVLASIRDQDHDGIIMAYSCFEQIPVSKEFLKAQYRELRDKLEKQLSQKGKNTARLKKQRETISEVLSELVVQALTESDEIFFDELGIDRLFVDEAHNFKNVPVSTQIDKVLGISSAGSAKCQDMLDKVRAVQRRNQGGGIIFATGTPITNSITDVYIMQRYLQSGELALLDLQSFDSWVGMFAERVTEFEVDVDTSSYRLATRFSKFHNLPELTTMLAFFTDFHQMDETAGIPKMDGYSDGLISKTPELGDYLRQISSRAEDVRRGLVPRTTDNMLKITGDGRKAALDIRLVEPGQPFTLQSKVAYCADHILDLYQETMSERGTQLVFCDSSTPKADFNIYDELKAILVSRGIPEEEIAFVHDAGSEGQRNRLFAAVRAGEVRVLIGSTFKLGLGVNVQDRLIAAHHLDVPWRPADMTQREGRILRRGNRYPKVKIFRYITEGSFDAYSWQLLETKQRFIADLLSGSLEERSGSDIENTVLDYAEIKALAVGNPVIKERIETANELTRYRTLQRRAVQNRALLEEELAAVPHLIRHQEELIQNCRTDRECYQHSAREYSKEQRSQLRSRLHTLLQENELHREERTAFFYQGFEVMLPANMVKERPFVWLKGSGKYYVELGDTITGNLIRIDNFLDGLDSFAEKQQRRVRELVARKSDIENLLRTGEDHSQTINELVRKLAGIDRELGVGEE